MSRYTEPKNRVSRKFGINVFSRLKNPLVHKPNPPGQHGAKRKKKSDFGIQLEEKQKLKAAFGMITERQLMRYYRESARFHKNTAEIFLQKLECRLDNLLFRLKFASTPFQAQQLVAHGHVFVDGKKVVSRSFVVRPGMVISIKPSARKMKIINEAMQIATRSVPTYLELNQADYSGKLLALPGLADISLPMEIDIHMICDFLSHKG
jgi:small subunit ribosomal protein S4